MTGRSLYGTAILLAFGIAIAAPVRVSAAPVGASAPPVGPVTTPGAQGRSACASHAAEAARRSRISETVILRVMHVESRGRANAISPKGAMGCMQIMPATWRYLTGRHSLGADPWDPRFNMIGGALYLAEMARRFGFPGAYAAYNAGPERYARHVRGTASLPAETRAYMASLSGGAHTPRARGDDARPARPRWQEAGLFLGAARQSVAPKRAAPKAASRSDKVVPQAAVDRDDTRPTPAIEEGDTADGHAGNRLSPHDLFPLAASARAAPRGNVFREE
jgi:hypothetical protein